MSGRKKRSGILRHDYRQLTLDWAAITPPPMEAKPQLPEEPPAIAPAESKPINLASIDSSVLIQILPWDFRTTFPAVMTDAINAGMVDEDDALPENLAALHGEYAAVMLATLVELRAVPRVAQEVTVRVEAAVGKYAEDFGQEAANDLLTYCGRQVVSSHLPRPHP